MSGFIKLKLNWICWFFKILIDLIDFFYDLIFSVISFYFLNFLVFFSPLSKQQCSMCVLQYKRYHWHWREEDSCHWMDGLSSFAGCDMMTRVWTDRCFDRLGRCHVLMLIGTVVTNGTYPRAPSLMASECKTLLLLGLCQPRAVNSACNCSQPIQRASKSNFLLLDHSLL
jgi:hypothetical protein